MGIEPNAMGIEQPYDARKHSWKAKLQGLLLSNFLRLQCATWHKAFLGLEHLDERMARNLPTLGVFWHGKHVPLFALLRNRQAVIFSSRSRRGDVIAEICERFGHHCVQIADHDGDHALDVMRRSLARGTLGAIAVDGPMGPYHAVKRGAIQLASELGFALLPISVAARRPRVIEARWDRMEIPRLFDSVVLGIAEPLTIPPDLAPGDLPHYATSLRSSLEHLDEVLEEHMARRAALSISGRLR